MKDLRRYRIQDVAVMRLMRRIGSRLSRRRGVRALSPNLLEVKGLVNPSRNRRAGEGNRSNGVRRKVM